MNRGRPKNFMTGQMVYVIIKDGKVRFHLAHDIEELGDYDRVLMPPLDPADYLAHEKAYQQHYKTTYEKQT